MPTASLRQLCFLEDPICIFPLAPKPRLHFLGRPDSFAGGREGGSDGQSYPQPVDNEFGALPGAFAVGRSVGHLRACASDKAAQSQVHGFVSTPGPSCFRFGSMFSGVPIHRIAGVFEPNRAMVTRSKSISARDLGTHKSKECGMGRVRGLTTLSATWPLPVTQSWIEFHLTQHPFPLVDRLAREALDCRPGLFAFWGPF